MKGKTKQEDDQFKECQKCHLTEAVCVMSAQVNY